MKGPFQYFEQKAFKENTLEKVLSSEDRAKVQATRAIACLATATYAAITLVTAKDAVDHATDAYRSGNEIVAGVESITAVGEGGLDALSGWMALEMAAFVVNSTRRVRELDNV